MRVQVNWLAAPRNQRRGQKLFTCRRFNCALIWFEWVGWRDPHFRVSRLLAMSAIRHLARYRPGGRRPSLRSSTTVQGTVPVIPLYFPVSHAKALTGGFQRARQNSTSLIKAVNDRAEQVMVDVRYWHFADIDADAEHVRSWG